MQTTGEILRERAQETAIFECGISEQLDRLGAQNQRQDSTGTARSIVFEDSKGRLISITESTTSDELAQNPLIQQGVLNQKNVYLTIIDLGQQDFNYHTKYLLSDGTVQECRIAKPGSPKRTLDPLYENKVRDRHKQDLRHVMVDMETLDPLSKSLTDGNYFEQVDEYWVTGMEARQIFWQSDGSDIAHYGDPHPMDLVG